MQDYEYNSKNDTFKILSTDGRYLTLKKEDIKDAVYLLMKFSVEIGMSNGHKDASMLFTKINAYLKKEDKIKYLNKMYAKYYPVDEYLEMFILYAELPGGINYGISNWKEYVYEYLDDEFDNIIVAFNNLTENDFFHNKLVELSRSSDHLNELLNTWKEVFEIYNLLETIKQKLLELDDFKAPIKRANGKTLKDMFNIPDQYDSIIRLLIEKKLVAKTKNGLEIILPKKFQKKGANFFMVAIAFSLRRMDYVKIGGDDIDIVEAMNNTFDNCNLSKQNYSYFKDSPKYSEYLEAATFTE
ncbi:hypothetical protein [Psychroserpens burtonensis]|uniref:hypothetical protein n=1 Tax=Psychroserpens burtonensis TaxID=49278 RepID=UPI000421A66B|nr:hypothetical protein [Psychroserpens burtonensis]